MCASMKEVLNVFLNQYNYYANLMDTQDLIDLRLYNSPNDAYLDRKKCKGPPFIVINGRNIRYPKEDFLLWLKDEKNSERLKKDNFYCWKCEKFYDESFFYQRKSPCKQCHRKIIRKWQQKNPEKVAFYRENEKAKLFCMKKIKKWYGEKFVSNRESYLLNKSGF